MTIKFAEIIQKTFSVISKLIFTRLVLSVFGFLLIGCGMINEEDTQGNSISPDSSERLSVSLNASTTSGIAPLTVDFTAPSSHSRISYAWDFDGDGIYDRDTGTNSSTSYTYTDASTYNATVMVTNDDWSNNSTDSAAITVSTLSNQPPTVSLTASTISGIIPLTVNFSADASDDGSVISYEWDLDGDGNYEQNTGLAYTNSYTYTTDRTYNIRVRVTDNDGATDTDMIAITANTTTPMTGSVTLSWVAPTTNEDGSPLTDLRGYRVYYGQNSGTYTHSINTNTTTATINSLSTGTWCFVTTAYDFSGNESNYSSQVCTVI